MAKNESDKTPCFAFNMMTISEEARSLWRADKDSRDPAVLLDSIEIVHSTKFYTSPVLMSRGSVPGIGTV